MNHVHPTFAPFLASIEPPKTELEILNDQFDRAVRILKEQRACNDAHAERDTKALKEQIQNNPEHWGIA